MDDDGLRWSKFWWQDYDQDPALRMCSLAAQGLWMRMLCLMHQGRPYGHLLVNGNAPNPKQLAAIVGASSAEVTKLIAELEQAGVFSRNPSGVAFNRRMVRDNQQREIGRSHGKRGGNPALKGKRKGEGLTPPNKPSLTGGDILQEAEAEAEAEKQAAARANRDPAFDLPGVKVDPPTGRPAINGFFVDHLRDRVLEAARMPETGWTTDRLMPLAHWLGDGLDPDDIVAAIRKRAGSSSYQPPTSLAYFDIPVRNGRRTA